MASKKYTLLATLLIVAAATGYSQLGGVIDYKDSSKVPSKKMAQQNEWRNNSPSQTFPAQPRNMWQLGIFGGFLGVNGDVPEMPGYNVGLSARKALGYVVSFRGSISYGQAKGLDYVRNGNMYNNNALGVYRLPGSVDAPPNAVGPGYYVHNFKSTIISPSFDLLFSLNNIMFHRKSNKLNVYALLGYTPLIYNTTLDALTGTNQDQAYNYNSLGADWWMDSRKNVRDKLEDFFDGEYETQSAVDDRTRNFDDPAPDNYQFRHSINAGLGVEYRLSSRVSLGLEMKYTRTPDDYIDGYQYMANIRALTPDKDNVYTGNFHFNYNLGDASKRVAPLWWINPLGYAYGELSNPSIMKFPKPVLDDTDNDGVTDQFDIEPNTPAGCPVDTKGKSRDTDGDGVPDCRDKELITPTACQPVNADGVGKCPDPECCKNIAPPPPACNIGSLPSVQFSGSAVKLGTDAQSILNAAASQIKANPLCKICVVGHGGASKREQQLSWDRVESVINYLVETQGISRDRFVFKYGEMGDANTVDLQDCTGEEGPNMVPAPHPQYRKTK